jgi:hypothetical protein
MAASKAALELLLQLKGDAQAARGAKNVQQELHGLAGAARGVQTTLKTMFAAVGGYAVMRAGLRLVAGAAREVRGAVFDMNSVLEVSGLQFETMMGSADLAREHIEMLFEFAKKTPFETEPIIEASRMLQAFGREALNTRETLTLIGDAAAATSAPIEALGQWTGRLYSQLQAGRPFGEAAQRLQELAVLSPEARNEMERLQKAGADADAIWAVFTADMERFTGAMERQANTWVGLKSTISDTVKLLSATAFKPLYEEAKRIAKTVVQMLDSEAAERGAAGIADAIQMVIDRAKTLVRTWIQRFGEMELGTARSVGRIAGFMVGLAKQAVGWGQNVVGSLAVGIASAVGLVTQAINFLGSVIGGLLKPGSPPALLPDLDTWGQGAAEAWLAGWTQADFGSLRDFASEVQGALRALAGMGEMEEGDVTPALLGSRQAFAQLLQDIRETGRASEEAFRRIREAAGPVGEQAEELARRYARVAESSGRLAEVQRRLGEIAGEQQDRLDTGRLAELEAILADPRASAGQKERARLEQEQIGLLMEQRDLQAEVDAAQGELDAYRSRLDVETETRDLLREEVELVKAIVDKVKEAAGGAGLGDDLEDTVERIGGVADELDELKAYDLSDLLKPLQELMDEMTLGFEEGELAAGNLGDTLGTLDQNMQTLNGHVETFNGTVGTTGQRLAGIIFFGGWLLRVVVGPLLTEMNALATNVGPRLNQTLGALVLGFQIVVAQLLGPLGLVAALAGVKLEAGHVLEGMRALGEGSFIQGMQMSWRLLLDPVRVMIDALKEAISLYERLRTLLGGAPRNVSENQLGDKPGSSTQGNAQGQALGTSYFGGGLALVGERGPELVGLPRGTRIWPAQQSMAMAGAAGGGNVTVNIGPVQVRNDEDIDVLVWKVVREIKRRER